MNILLIGGAGNLINNLIVKLNKEGHRISLLTGERYEKASYQRVFEKYNFPYESESLKEIFESIAPELTIFMGAYDTNFKWSGKDVEKEAVRFSGSLMNILMAYSQCTDGRFLYLSTHDVYSGDYPDNITETEPVMPNGIPGMVWSQGEEMCENYRKSCGKDIIVLRLDHVYGIPENRKDVRDICSRMCLEALESGRITVCGNRVFSLLYVTDAVEFIYRLAVCGKHGSFLYHLSSMKELTEPVLANMICQAWEEPLEQTVLPEQEEKDRVILSNNTYESEFGNLFFCETTNTINRIALQMKRHAHLYLNYEKENKTLTDRIKDKANRLFKNLIPFAENLILFIPFFMLNNRAVGSEYFANLDFYLLYVLLFAIVYGQSQAILSSTLAAAGYCFRQMYERSSFEVMIDANTYVWIAQLFVLGLTVGYMRDQIIKLKQGRWSEKEYLDLQLTEIQDINSSNMRVKAALEAQIINQQDSLGKIYSITSTLDQYGEEEVLFYAAEMLSKLMHSKDVAIYTVFNKYARLFSATSTKARQMGNSIQYKNMGEMYEALRQKKVFINRKMEDQYPLMANAVYDNEEMKLIVMVWDIPWERMTLGQANQLTVISMLIQNAVLKANRYLSALEGQRYVAKTHLLTPEAFQAMVNAYLKARRLGLTECVLLSINAEENGYMEAVERLVEKIRSSDFIGTLLDGGLYVLLANTNDKDADYVRQRFAELGYASKLVESV